MSFKDAKVQEKWLGWEQWNHTEALYDDVYTLAERFQQIANITPEAAALISATRCLTYGELEILSNNSADNLLSRELEPASVIAVLGGRGWELVVVILGILKAGFTYLPLNVKDAPSRIKSILDEAKPSLVLTQEECQKICVLPPQAHKKHRSLPKINSEAIAYIMYTSGSTGSPKGVAMTHVAVLNTLDDMRERLALNSQDRLFALSELSFDLSVFDVFAGFFSGAAVVLLEDEASKNPEIWLELIYTHKITIWNSVPALIDLLIQHLEYIENSLEILPLRWVLLSGDLIASQLPQKIKKFVSERCRILALGGSTEAAIWSISTEITDYSSDKPIPYGRPMKNQKMLIIDEQGLLLPPGTPGEITIAGIGLALCYWQNPMLTASRFPILPGIGRVFKTRDLGVINLDTQEMEFMGRLDRQAKIQGHRVDLTEIEQKLSKIKGVDSAVVLAIKEENQRKKLVAFLKEKHAEIIPQDQEIRQKLSTFLSAAMIPREYIWLKEWPLTTNGKIDWHALAGMTTKQFALLPSQKGMLYEWMKKSEGTYMVLATLFYNQELDSSRFRWAYQQLVSEFDVLQQSIQRVETPELFNICFHSSLFTAPYVFFDWSEDDDLSIEKKLNEREQSSMAKGINPFQRGAFFIEHFRLPNGKDKVYFYYNHLFLDAVSSTLLIDRLHQIYQQKNYQYIQQPSIKQFLNFNLQHTKHDSLDFWKKEWGNIQEATLIASVGTNNIRPHSFKQKKLFISFTSNEKEKLQMFLTQHHVSYAVFFQSCWSLLLAFWLDQKQVVSGLVYSGKQSLSDEWKKYAGCFANTLPFSISIDPSLSFISWMQKVQQQIHLLKQHDRVSLLEMMEMDEKKNSIYFDSILTILNFPRPDKKQFPALEKVTYDQVTDFPLTIQFDPESMELFFKFQSAEKNAALIISSFHFIIRQALNEPYRLLNQFSLNGHVVYGGKYEQKQDIMQMLQENIAFHPQAVAYIVEHQKISYQQLWKKVEQCTHYLKAHMVGTVLGIMLPRDESWIVTLLACLSARITFMPIGLDWPKALMQKRLKEAHCQDILSLNGLKNKTLSKKFPENHHNISYIIFTSGSTGEAKGVRVSYEALHNNITVLCHELNLQPNDRWLSVTQPTFDIFLLEILAPFCVGATLLFPDDKHVMDPELLKKWITHYHPTYLQTTPSRWKIFLEAELPLDSLQYVLVGGETLTQELCNILRQAQNEIINLYGPTETTIWTTLAHLKLDETVNIGHPISNTFCAVVNQWHQILPQGVVGELCIGGSGLATDYLQSEETEKAFIELHLESNKVERVYKTGDFVRINDNGDIDFIGRRDRQLKIRGQRVDLIEIEHALCASGLIKKAVVMPSSRDSQSLVAYFERESTDKQSTSTVYSLQQFSLFCFPEVRSFFPSSSIIDFYQKLAKRADKLGLYGMWTPERHFSEIGAPFSSPAVIMAALAGVTDKLVLGAGSLVLPLHHTVKIAEQWSTLDCFYPGRIRFSVASGWHPNDFIFSPENYANRKKILFDKVRELKDIWREGVYQAINGVGEMCSVQVFPRPIQKECPLWITVADDSEVCAEAGRLGCHLLTHLLMQDIDSLAEKLELYRQNLLEFGFDPTQKQVTVMLHTYIHSEPGMAYKKAKKPLEEYFHAHLRLLANMQGDSQTTESFTADYFETKVKNFVENKCLIGTPKNCMKLLHQLKAIGVTEIATLVDFGLSEEDVLEGVESIALLAKHHNVSFFDSFFDSCFDSCFELPRLKDFLHQTLPPIMHPSDFIEVDSIPLTSHGKVDFQALKDLKQVNEEEIKQNHPLQKKSNESEMIAIWCKVLKKNTIDTNASFFDNGGHSLKAIELLSEVYKVFQVKISLIDFIQHPWVSYLEECIRKKDSSSVFSEHIFPLSPMQKGIWVFCQFFPDTFCYHDAFLYKILFSVSPELFINKLNALFAQDPLFRLRFFEKNDEVFQEITSIYFKADLIYSEYFDVEKVKQMMSKPFDLTQAPLVRAVVYVSQGHLYLQLVFHHLLTDGGSLAIFFERLQALLLEPSSSTQNIDRHYLEYIEKKQTPIISQALLHDYVKEIGLARLKNTLSIGKSSSQRSFKGFQHQLLIEEEELQQLKKFAAISSASISNILLAIFAKTLMSFINEELLQIALPISLREESEKNCLGLFINFGVIALKRSDVILWDWLKWVNEIKWRNAFVLEHRQIPFASVAAAVGSSLLTEAQPLSQFVFNAFEAPLIDKKMFEPIELDYDIARFDLETQVGLSEEHIQVKFIFSDDIFSQAAALQWGKFFKKTLSAFINFNQNHSPLSPSSPELATDSFRGGDERVVYYWKNIYNALYEQVNDLQKQAWLGWNDSINGQPFSVEVMQDWLENIVMKIKRFPLGQVLELGCGTGQIMQSLQKCYLTYEGIDISASVIQKLNELYQNENTHFSLLSANQINSFSKKFNTIIMNSVAQYFPNLDYIETILQKASHLLDTTSSVSRIILGDLRHEGWQEFLYEYLQKNNGKYTKEDYFLLEKETFVNPLFIWSLIKHWSIPVIPLFEPKYTHYLNELTNFRFDLSLYIGNVQFDKKRKPPIILDTHEFNSLEKLLGIIQKNFPHEQQIIVVKEIYNARIVQSRGFDPTVLYQAIQDYQWQGWVSLDLECSEKLLLCIGHPHDDFIAMLYDFNRVFDGVNTLSQKIIERKEVKKNQLPLKKSLLEYQLINIWKSVLNINDLDLKASFFDLGGNSMLYIKLFHKIRSLGYVIKMADILPRHTVHEQAEFLSQLR